MSDLRVLVIDDMRIAKEPGAVHATTPYEGVQKLGESEWDVVCLDHDMGYDFDSGQELTIRPVIRFIEENVDKFQETTFYIVTSNPYAAEWMEQALDNVDLLNFTFTEAEKKEAFDYRSWEDMTGH